MAMIISANKERLVLEGTKKEVLSYLEQLLKLHGDVKLKELL